MDGRINVRDIFDHEWVRKFEAAELKKNAKVTEPVLSKEEEDLFRRIDSVVKEEGSREPSIAPNQNKALLAEVLNKVASKNKKKRESKKKKDSFITREDKKKPIMHKEPSKKPKMEELVENKEEEDEFDVFKDYKKKPEIEENKPSLKKKESRSLFLSRHKGNIRRNSQFLF